MTITGPVPRVYIILVQPIRAIVVLNIYSVGGDSVVGDGDDNDNDNNDDDINYVNDVDDDGTNDNYDNHDDVDNDGDDEINVVHV